MTRGDAARRVAALFGRAPAMLNGIGSDRLAGVFAKTNSEAKKGGRYEEETWMAVGMGFFGGCAYHHFTEGRACAGLPDQTD